MSVAAKYNKGGKWEVNLPQNVKYVKLKELEPKEHIVRGIYFTEKGKYGKSVAVYDGEVMINLPSHMVTTCEEMVADIDAITAINSGKLGIMPYAYELSDYPGQTFWGARWVDL